jgi:hypothetical protein
MTKEQILEYVISRASGVNQAPNYTYKDFHCDIVKMYKEQVKQDNKSISECCKAEIGFLIIN